VFAATAIPGYDRRFTADWAKDNEQRDAAQRAERQRHADYLARLPRSRRSAKIERRGNVSLRASAKGNGGSNTE
jgi:hypothetical protein